MKGAEPFMHILEDLNIQISQILLFSLHCGLHLLASQSIKICYSKTFIRRIVRCQALPIELQRAVVTLL